MLKKKRLAQYVIAQGLSSDELDEVILCCDVLEFKDGDPIIKEHSINSSLYILEEGRVSVQIEVCREEKESMEEIAILDSGDVFGEIAFLEEWRRSACVMAVGDVSVLKLDGDRLHWLFERNNHIGYLMMRNLGLVLARRLMDTNYLRKIDIEDGSVCEDPSVHA
ncbi:Cyclic nucleotide-binding domain-containing protein [Desulfatibacillum alkenivorans DSM 16219]|jgi:CRP-like cAMP-binding protein|uniref:Cyclic nucleotide-binding domain-containing protein n=1 Tax=Desulfatibacillum alkenivorans DSM 16219 TaxID=1121393 RepID=A0A1M6S4A2_9BACT|nr:cyclic nucleotide-binding domain-containing protein [Desulfatibacillum alkenivorans]SHK39545.1 Cyclic nucleotide-binding domain-containing protein [Desulfatibacillum alkenivorans DSM 16219]